MFNQLIALIVVFGLGATLLIYMMDWRILRYPLQVPVISKRTCAVGPTTSALMTG